MVCSSRLGRVERGGSRSVGKEKGQGKGVAIAEGG